MVELYEALQEDLIALGIDLSKIKVELNLKDYSSAYNGRYYPEKNLIVLYVFYDKWLMGFRSYYSLLETLLHEAIHAVQYQSAEYQRVKGIMHDPEFYRLFNKYSVNLREVAGKRKLRLTV